ncbi:metal-binding protein [Nocardioides psychrotolerans]|uniref:Copper chaperone/Cu+-exporting ATPase n=1 Tax=Nocardioides psychrotolerans TaxID=1005945 RepID=A0A1I3RBG5_9ACTN|nr:heavy metal-associated domain-containing protein [Nocardioides psychrotolerans]GEP40349.1 metal-binding protein [Nocardioides psychrotolerans]SFJ42677.1 copper chaperone/Cu+-exporting ATPase [Nocardioides psychrotolerans]
MSNNTTYTVAGMTCGSCATKVTEAVSDLDGVTHLAVDLATGTLVVTGEVEQDQVREAVTAAGYQVS